MQQLGLGGSCHWCLEAVFQMLRGVHTVQQGWIAPDNDETAFSEAVLISYDEKVLPLSALVDIHLATHSSTSQHSLRNKYRSALYVFNKEQQQQAHSIIQTLQVNYHRPIVTETLLFGNFKSNTDNYLNYYRKDPEKPFCKTWIEPKLKLLVERFGNFVSSQEATKIRRSKGV